MPATPALSAFQKMDRLSADLKQAATELTPREVRYYTDRYYQLQDQRKRAANQLRAAESATEPNRLLQFDLQQTRQQEANIKNAMEAYARSKHVGQWLLSLYGIGPVIASGLMAHIDITRAPAAGHVWSFAGLNPTVKWLSREEADAWVRTQPKPVTNDTIFAAAAHFRRPAQTLLRDATMDWKTGEALKALTATSLAAALARCPWNQKFKGLAWKAADCFKKFHNRNPQDNLYGALYVQNKAKALQKDADGEFAALAQESLNERSIQDAALRKTYEAGRFPAGRIDLWAMRATAKLFLSHVHHALYETHYGTPPPQPYILAHDPRHTHYIPPPHWPFIEGKNYAIAEDEDDD